MDKMNVPIIRLEVERMKYTVLSALQQHAADIDSNIQKAVEEYCAPENIEQVVSKYVKESVDFAVKEEIRDFFRYSNNGRKAIREAVNLYLEEYFSDIE